MNLFLIGATGKTGHLVLEQALSRGHTVTAIIRKQGSLRSNERLQVVVGDPLRANVLAPLLANQDVVISCLGQRSRQDANLLRDAAAAVLEAMRRTNVRRYLVVSQGLLFPSRNPIVAILRLILARFVADSKAMERLVRTSDIDWTIVRPPRLKEGGAPRGYRVQPGAQPGGALAMQRADLAAFLLDEAEREDHRRKIVGITSA
ncbi:MAG: NAD(P)-dependent oxidoreductase [Dehalococcoidia bacterium]